jgi:hypothetical protein
MKALGGRGIYPSGRRRECETRGCSEPSIREDLVDSDDEVNKLDADEVGDGMASGVTDPRLRARAS